MEECKVGEYCRLARNQGIRKIEEIDEEGYWLDDYIADEFGEATLYLYKSELKNEVENHSENIIDLIQCGDYVNGGKVVEIDASKDWIDNSEEDTVLRQEDIKSIVTKEQFSSVEYRLEE